MNETTPEFVKPTYEAFQPLLPWDSKTIAILRSVSSIVSVVASSVLIWMILRSKKRLTVPYHRMLLGMSVADLVVSIPNSFFQVLTPTDIDYLVWNARGNLASCLTQGFLSYAGNMCVNLYAVSLNIYFLLAVKYNKKDKEVKSKYEIWLHGVPIASGLAYAIAMISTDHINPDALGLCGSWRYSPPHCAGIEKGDVPEGFEIPCNRGVMPPSHLIAWQTFQYTMTFGIPILILGTLAMLYVFVKRQENKMTRYGAGALDIANAEPSADNSRASSGIISFASRITSSLSSSRRLKKAARKKNAKSRSFLTRGVQFTVSYFLVFGFPVTINSMTLANKPDPLTPPAWLLYCLAVFPSLQGLYNFLIFLYPKVVDAKRVGKDISWCSALVKVFRPGATSSKFSKQASAKTSRLTDRSGLSERSVNVKPSRQEEEKEEEKEEVDEEIQE